MEKKYWKTPAEIENPALVGQLDNEFAEGSAALNSISESISDYNTGRRDFLKMLGFSVGAATIAASCEIPVRKSIPYVFKPEDITPGVANYYASSYIQNGDYCSVLVKTREGRPIKLEGNNDSIVTQGGTSAQVQASILGLYDNARYKFPLKGGKQTTWKTTDAEISTQLAAISQSGGKIALLSSTIISPSTKSVIADFITKYPTAYHVTYDAVSASAILLANQSTFGIKALPSYKFDQAEVIVSIGADFLGTWISPTEFAADYSKNRRVSKDNMNMSRHIQIESVPSITGSSADERIQVSASQEASAVAELYNAISGVGATSIKGLDKVAKELLAAKAANKKCIVVCGVNDVNVQTVVNAINSNLGAYGTTIDNINNSFYKQGIDADVVSLVNEIKSGVVKALIVLDSNPVYSLPMAKEFTEALQKMELSVSLADKLNETSDLCKYVCPSHHWLESWNDANPKAGVYATTQPTIAPLFDTRQAQESLLAWSGNSMTYYEYIQNVWKNSIASKQSSYSGFSALWENTLQNGELILAQGDGSSSFNSASVAEAIAKIGADYKKAPVEIKIYSTIIGDGTHGDNPYLLELPDPVTKVTWDNYIVANPKWMKDNGLENEWWIEKKFFTIKLTSNSQVIELPVYPLPGVSYGTLGLQVGFGRQKVNSELQRGKNIYSLLVGKNGCFSAIATASVSKNTGFQNLATTQMHFTINHQGLGGEKTRLVVKETTLTEYKKDNQAGNTIIGKPRKEWIEHHLTTLYGEHTMPGHQWGMVVDLNTCTGCSACVVACNIENNVPVVGQDEVRRSHEMHWLRIDRYYTGDIENPDVVFQPMMCQHCDNAPCENVCPVSATNHSSEGINQMAYNRCIGTRYCANNCPYKVRRFNWFDYTGSDSFNKDTFGVDNYDDKLGFFEPLTRMILNPDVTTRSRGVIEKCSFCVQRIQSSKLDAKKAGEELKDGAVKTACQTACPTNAITFGDVNNKNTKVAKLIEDDRAFGVIEEIHTLPSVLYLTKVRNRENNHV